MTAFSSASPSALTLTPTPLVLLGPGGDFTDRLNVKGTALTRVRGNRPSAHAATADGDNPGAPGYERPRHADAGDVLATDTGVRTAVSRAADGFDASPNPTAQTYGPDGRLRTPARVSVLSAAAAWLEMQSLTVSDLAHDHAQHRRAVLASIRPAAVHTAAATRRPGRRPGPAPRRDRVPPGGAAHRRRLTSRFFDSDPRDGRPRVRPTFCVPPSFREPLS